MAADGSIPADRLARLGVAPGAHLRVVPAGPPGSINTLARSRDIRSTRCAKPPTEVSLGWGVGRVGLVLDSAIALGAGELANFGFKRGRKREGYRGDYYTLPA